MFVGGGAHLYDVPDVVLLFPMRVELVGVARNSKHVARKHTYGDGQSPPNMEIVAVHCRAGFSPISVTQKTKLVFWLPQPEYRETLAERNVDIANTNNLLILEFCNCCILAQNSV